MLGYCRFIIKFIFNLGLVGMFSFGIATSCKKSNSDKEDIPAYHDGPINGTVQGGRPWIYNYSMIKDYKTSYWISFWSKEVDCEYSETDLAI